ncbi:unnamed protein product [Somion occarium]|uniref:Uncharacterized protein n=1 Tax=Somion occarium TaxID=3059160 RepID=A0ABP1E9F5_9APHY
MIHPTWASSVRHCADPVSSKALLTPARVVITRCVRYAPCLDIAMPYPGISARLLQFTHPAGKRRTDISSTGAAYKVHIIRNDIQVSYLFSTFVGSDRSTT